MCAHGSATNFFMVSVVESFPLREQSPCTFPSKTTGACTLYENWLDIVRVRQHNVQSDRPFTRYWNCPRVRIQLSFHASNDCPHRTAVIHWTDENTGHNFLPPDTSAMGRHLLWRRGCLCVCVCHVDVLCPRLQSRLLCDLHQIVDQSF